jgi:hypothetical protein
MPDKDCERVIESMKVHSQHAVDVPMVVPGDAWW